MHSGSVQQVVPIVFLVNIFGGLKLWCSIRSKAGVCQILHIWIYVELERGLVEKHLWDTYYKHKL